MTVIIAFQKLLNKSDHKSKKKYGWIKAVIFIMIQKCFQHIMKEDELLPKDLLEI